MVGIGYDIHKLVVGRKLFLGGIQIDFEKGLLGHSDGDALIHAICDALLGAANLGDIGTHFPPSDEQFKNMASLRILKSVSKFIQNAGFLIKKIDSIVIAEEPKIQPHIREMKAAIATTLGISEDVISIKGKTNEGFGGVGAGQAIAAWAICEIGRIYASAEG